jgi:hypothetical protein
MKLRRPIRRVDRRLELLDAQMESYVNWRTETRFVAESYRKWRSARGYERAVAFERYVAALDREELAAGDYRRATELVHNT